MHIFVQKFSFIRTQYKIAFLFNVQLRHISCHFGPFVSIRITSIFRTRTARESNFYISDSKILRRMERIQIQWEVDVKVSNKMYYKTMNNINKCAESKTFSVIQGTKKKFAVGMNVWEIFACVNWSLYSIATTTPFLFLSLELRNSMNMQKWILIKCEKCNLSLRSGGDGSGHTVFTQNSSWQFTWRRLRTCDWRYWRQRWRVPTKTTKS